MIQRFQNLGRGWTGVTYGIIRHTFLPVISNFTSMPSPHCYQTSMVDFLFYHLTKQAALEPLKPLACLTSPTKASILMVILRA